MRELPQAIEMEESLLGVVLQAPEEVISEVAQILHGPDDFYNQQHATIYRKICELYESSQNVDVRTLFQALKDADLLENIGGMETLTRLVDSVPYSAAGSAPYYAKQIRDKARLRAMIEAAEKTIETGYNNQDRPEEVIDQAEQRMFEIAQQDHNNNASSIGEIANGICQRLEQGDTHVSGIKTGFHDLDAWIGGLKPGNMVVVAGRPGKGKTAFAVSIAQNIAIDHVSAIHSDEPVPVGIFSLEMNRDELANRILASMTDIPGNDIANGKLQADEFQRLAEATGELATKPLVIDDTGNLSIMQLRAKARRMVAKHGIKVLIVDYLGLMSHKAENKVQEVSALSRGIKVLAKELNIPIICLSQLNRQSETRDDRKPRLSDLRDSGSIEQDAHIVILLHRNDDAEKTNVILAKNRNGPMGNFDMIFDRQSTRFMNMAYAG